MEYKEMAKVMTDEEVKTCMAILIEDRITVRYSGRKKSKFY